MTAILQASIPRSGNHLLLKLLWDAIPNGYISTCEFYTSPNCCRQIPCLNVAREFIDAPNQEGSNGRTHIFIHKTHDFQLSDLPTSHYRTLFQLRDPHQYLLSHLIWELCQMTDFSIGSALAFAHKSAIYYIRMYIKWSVLYSDTLVVPPIYYESLLTRSGKLAALRSISQVVGLALTDEQLNYSVARSTLHSHSGAAFKSSAVKEASTIIRNPLVIQQCSLLSNTILRLLPNLSSIYSPNYSVDSADLQHELLPVFDARMDPGDEFVSIATVQLTGDRKVSIGASSGRALYLSGVGIGNAYSDGSYMIGCVTLLPIKLPQKSPISTIEVLVKSPISRLSENESLANDYGLEFALIYLNRIIGWLHPADDRSVLYCRTDLDTPIIPYSETILIALGIRPQTDVSSICDQSRAFRFISEINIRFSYL